MNQNFLPIAPIALVTGASSGIGQAAALQLAKAGYKVYGTSRRGAQSGESTFPMLALDVTNDASVEAAIAELMQREGRIDLLVNNAGVGIAPAAAEESSLTQVQAIFDTNVFGTVRMTHAVLPVMRAQGSGRILNVGSVLGFIPAPFAAHYSAAKHAIEGYSESLDHEVRGFGVRVSVIEPGATNTSFEGSAIPRDRTLDAYNTLRLKYQEAFGRTMADADTAQSVAKTVVVAARDQKPLLRYASGKAARQLTFLRRFIPRALFDKSLHKQFGLA